MSPASHSQGRILRAGTCFTFSEQITYAAPAEFRVFSVAANLFTHMPATFALVMFERGAFELFFCIAYNCCFGADEDKAQVVTERGQDVVLFPVSVDQYLCLQ